MFNYDTKVRKITSNECIYMYICMSYVTYLLPGVNVLLNAFTGSCEEDDDDDIADVDIFSSIFLLQLIISFPLLC